MSLVAERVGVEPTGLAPDTVSNRPASPTAASPRRKRSATSGKRKAKHRSTRVQPERACPRCSALLCRYNDGPYCWPCMYRVPEGCALMETREGWTIVRVTDAPWRPQPGDMLIGSLFTPAPRRKYAHPLGGEC